VRKIPLRHVNDASAFDQLITPGIRGPIAFLPEGAEIAPAIATGFAGCIADRPGQRGTPTAPAE
jgi:hypothetical protein